MWTFTQSISWSRGTLRILEDHKRDFLDLACFTHYPERSLWHRSFFLRIYCTMSWNRRCTAVIAGSKLLKSSLDKPSFKSSKSSLSLHRPAPSLLCCGWSRPASLSLLHYLSYPVLRPHLRCLPSAPWLLQWFHYAARFRHGRPSNQLCLGL